MEDRAIKNDDTKMDLSLIPLCAEEAEAEALMVGQRKYGRYNYCKGMEASRVMAALLRHAKAWYEGEERCPKDGQLHLGSVRACTSMLLRMQQLGTLVDDRYKPERKQESEQAIKNIEVCDPRSASAGDGTTGVITYSGAGSHEVQLFDFTADNDS